MRYLNYGYVLLMMLITMQVLSCLGLYLIFSAYLECRLDLNRWFSIAQHIDAEMALKAIEGYAMMQQPICLIPTMPSDELTAKSSDWWSLYGCGSDTRNVHYRYVVERLGSDGCGVMEDNTKHTVLHAKYERITLMVASSKLQNMRLYLQSTIAKPVEGEFSCDETLHVVQPGRQMMREMASLDEHFSKSGNSWEIQS